MLRLIVVVVVLVANAKVKIPDVVEILERCILKTALETKYPPGSR